MRKICIFTGARPNFIKVAPLIRAIRRTDNCDYQLVFAGPEADATIEPSLFDDLQMPAPDVCLGVDSQNLNEITGRVMEEFDKYLSAYDADTVIVVDDLASTMAAAIVAKKRGLRLAHLVAGTRSFDIAMPKEVNRLVIDGLSDLLFTAGAGSSSVATRGGAELNKIFMVGNILIDSLRFNLPRFRRPRLMDSVNGSYMVFTINRKVLLSDKQKMADILQALGRAADGVTIIAPLRPWAKGKVDEALKGLPSPKVKWVLTDSLPYLEFGWLTAHAAGIITDSGNVAEEATFNNVPCITLNSYTEHQETVKQGTNVLVGENPALLEEAVGRLLAGNWQSTTLPDRWDGRSAERIVQILA